MVLSKWLTLKIPIPAASSGAFQNFVLRNRVSLILYQDYRPGGAFGSAHSSPPQAAEHSGVE